MANSTKSDKTVNTKKIEGKPVSKSYDAPKILSAENLEVAASTCASGPFGKPDIGKDCGFGEPLGS